MTSSIGQVTMSPKTAGAYIDVTRKLILQSSPAVEGLIRDDLMALLSNEIDSVAINGKSADNKPIGILNTVGIGSVICGGTLSWGDICDLETEVFQNNADVPTLGWLTHPKVKGILKQTFLNSTYGEIPLWGKDPSKKAEGMLSEFPAWTSTNVPATLGAGSDAALIFGNFNDMIIGVWGNGIEINVDETTYGLSGGKRIIALLDCDVAIRHVESFAAAVDVAV